MSLRGSVVIVTYNAADSICACLRSLAYAAQEGWLKVIVVDNASTDDTVAIVRREFGWVNLVEAGENGGFGAGNNIGFGHTEGDWVFILNPDSEVKRGCIEHLEARIMSGDNIGCSGPLVMDEHERATVSFFPFTNLFYSVWSAVGALRLVPVNYFDGKWRIVRRAPRKEVKVDQLLGAAMMIRRDVWESIGGYDERFFLFSEEEDYCKRIINAGWHVAFCPEARMLHIGAGSTQNVMPLAVASANWSRYLYMRKHCSGFAAEISRYVWLSTLFIRYMITGVLHAPHECKEQRLGYRMSMRSLWNRGWFERNLRPPRHKQQDDKI